MLNSIDLNAFVVEYYGNQDAIRYGFLQFNNGHARCFHYDRLNNKVTLWNYSRWEDIGLRYENDDLRYKEAAVVAIKFYEQSNPQPEIIN